jgi:hypothetical protein
VVAWLGDAGIGEERIDWFVSHRGGPGADADAAIRAMWQRADAEGRVQSLSFDDVFIDAEEPSRRLAGWVAAQVGPLEHPLEDISGGAWRTIQRREGSDIPPVHPWQERRKFIAVARGRRWLVKFAGLGCIGEHALARARSLARAGFVSTPVGLAYGFLIEAWRDDATPLPESMSAPLRQQLLETVAAYLGHRARSFPAGAESGASLDGLLAMARFNSAEAFGEEVATVWTPWESRLGELAADVRRVETDSRMQRWEWLVGAESIVKADALDHHAGHDLVGCQDIAWDVVGAIVELGLDGEETRCLMERVEQHGAPVSPDLVAFIRICYLAFQMGYYREAERASADADEAARLNRECARYATSLRALMTPGCSPVADFVERKR